MTATDFYHGLIGTVYAAAIDGQHFAEDTVFSRIVAAAGGTALELGSGTGRLLLRLVGAGHDVHGLEISEEMTAVCRADAARRGLNPVIHHGSFAPLADSFRGYAAMYCPLNAFGFVTDDELALESVRSHAAGLRPGGVLALAGSAGDPLVLRTRTGWVRRHDVRIEDDRTAEVDERRLLEADGRCLRVERIIRVVDREGEVHATEESSQLRRLRPISDLARMFAEAGLTDLHAFGSDSDYVLTGRKG